MVDVQTFYTLVQRDSFIVKDVSILQFHDLCICELLICPVLFCNRKFSPLIYLALRWNFGRFSPSPSQKYITMC